MKIDEMVSHLQYDASFFNVHMHFCSIYVYWETKWGIYVQGNYISVHVMIHGSI